MALDILNPTIHKETKGKGGFCVVDESLIDGVNYFEIDSSVFGLDLLSSQWEQMATTTLYNSSDGSTDIWGGDLYTFGGVDATNVYNNTLLKYDIPTNTYSSIPLNDVGDGVPVPRAVNSGKIINGKFYFFGGRNSSGILSDFWSIDTLTGNCELLTSSLSGSGVIPDIKNHDSAVIGTEFYIYGGISSGFLGQNNELYVYDTYGDPATTVWTMLSNSGVGNSQMRMVSIDGYLYIYGGDDPVFPIFSRDVLRRYDPSTNIWEYLTSGPVQIKDHCMFAYKNKLYWSGGDYFSVPNTELWSYKPAIGKDSKDWVLVDPSTPLSFGLSSGGGYKGWLYIQYRDTVWKYKINDVMAIRLPRGL